MMKNPFIFPRAGGSMHSANPQRKGGTHAQNRAELPGGRQSMRMQEQRHAQNREHLQNKGGYDGPYRGRAQNSAQNQALPRHPLVMRQHASTQYEPYRKTAYPAKQEMNSMQPPARRAAMVVIPLDPSDPAVAEFLAGNAKTGYLKVRVSALGGAMPIPQAVIKVYLNIAGTRHLLAVSQSDGSGMSEIFSLPTPDKQLTFDPRNPKPYSTYDIVVEHPAYEPVETNEVPVFDGITSVQRVNMVVSAH